MDIDALNGVAMKLILHAGNCRENIQLAMKQINDYEICEKYLEIARQEILKAHRSQTQVIQETIDNDLSINLLFVHAQDTVMTINSELITAQYIFSVYKEIKNMIEELKE